MAIRHRNIQCNEFLCLPEVNTSHYEEIPDPPRRTFDQAAEEFLRDMGSAPNRVSHEVTRSLTAGRQWVEAIMPDLWPLILERFRAMADLQARTLADAALAQPGLDEVSLLALCDWLRENRHDGIADEVARMRLEGGDLLLLRSPTHLTGEQAASAAAGVRKMIPEGVRCLILPLGWDAAAIRWVMPKETNGG